MSSSYRIRKIEVDEERLGEDLATVEPFGFLPAYDEFICGSWRTCMLWNANGDGGDTRIRDYDGPAHVTEYGARAGYLQELLDGNFNLEHLRFARLARLGPGSVVLPHRDFLELDSELTRIHVPVETARSCYTSQESTIYRMRQGEVWAIDASRPHSIANFSDGNRTHLLLDFACDVASTVHSDSPMAEDASVSPTASIPEDASVSRRPLREGEKEAFLELAEIVDSTNLRDILAIVIKRYFVAELDVTDVFRWLGEIATQSGDKVVREQLEWLERHSLALR